ARLCAATGTRLHLIEPLGFRLTDKALRRAGIDYWESVPLTIHRSYCAYLESEHPDRLFALSTSGTTAYTEPTFQSGDSFLFGSESRGIPLDLLMTFQERVLNIPMQLNHVRSLNLATAAGIVLFEALRQIRKP
ncbi:MAG: tRNA (cytidine(34)-2'-O)-methyltransferase, partial [Kiritimatiellia bacterium]|nr:tRNA (cytidine(34)-2'-O)-methyltransferase [Kiritimatiellia bacterium]